MSKKEDMHRIWDMLFDDDELIEDADSEDIIFDDDEEWMEVVRNMDMMEPQDFMDNVENLLGDSIKDFENLVFKDASPVNFSERYKSSMHVILAEKFGEDFANRIDQKREERKEQEVINFEDNEELMEVVRNMDKMEPQDFMDNVDNLLGDRIKDSESLISRDTPPVNFSERYKSDMNAMLVEKFGEDFANRIGREREERTAKKEQELQLERKRQEKPEKRKNWKRFMLPMASTVAVCIVVGTITMSVDALRLPIINFFTNTQDKYSGLKTIDDSVESGDMDYPEEIEVVYTLNKVIDGYSLSDQGEMSKLVKERYVEVDNFYVFIQQTRDLDAWINTESVYYEEVDTIYSTAYFCDNEGQLMLVWNYKGYTFKIYGDIAKEQMLDLLNSLVLK